MAPSCKARRGDTNFENGPENAVICRKRLSGIVYKFTALFNSSEGTYKCKACRGTFITRCNAKKHLLNHITADPSVRQELRVVLETVRCTKMTKPVYKWAKSVKVILSRRPIDKDDHRLDTRPTLRELADKEVKDEQPRKLTADAERAKAVTSASTGRAAWDSDNLLGQVDDSDVEVSESANNWSAGFEPRDGLRFMEYMRRKDILSYIFHPELYVAYSKLVMPTKTAVSIQNYVLREVLCWPAVYGITNDEMSSFVQIAAERSEIGDGMTLKARNVRRIASLLKLPEGFHEQ